MQFYWVFLFIVIIMMWSAAQQAQADEEERNPDLDSPGDGWEYKILRSPRKRFKDLEFQRQVLAEDAEAEEEADDFSESDSAIAQLANKIINDGYNKGVSDIHMEPYPGKQPMEIRFRLDGACQRYQTVPPQYKRALVSRIKIMAKLDIAERRKPQDGKFQMKIGRKAIDFRVSILPVVWGEKTVFRILDSSNLALDIESLGFEKRSMEDYQWACKQPYGMILVTGPTGSGKSTTLYSAVRGIAQPDINLVTVEDPVEYQLEGINQVPVNVKAGLTFAAALRSILRQDPDVCLIGEIRDHETLEIAVKAALTGHLVLSTLHTNDAPSTITRMIDMGCDPFMVASSTLLICAQRLGRKLCANCRKPAKLSKDALLRLGFLESELDAEMELYEPVGCPRCTNGYKGRFALLETMRMTEGIKRMVVDRAHIADIKKLALEEGMLTLRRCGLLNAMRGKTSLQEIQATTMAD